MIQVFIVDAVRSPIGKYKGALKEVRPDDLAAHVLRELVARAELPPLSIDEVLLGCANQAGEDNRNVARMAVLLSSFPETVPGITLNRLCASGMDAVIHGARMIATNEADVVIAGGVESMTRAPWSMPKPPDGFPLGKWEIYDTSLGWRYPNPKLEALFPLEQMGETAENVAAEYQISRAAQDEFALRSHQRAVQAMRAGRFAQEVVVLSIPQRKGTLVMSEDEGPRSDTSLEKLSALSPAFRRGGSVTAGNSSTLSDGAAALLLMSEKALAKFGKQPLARYVSSASVGLNPRVMGMGPVPATRKLLDRAGWRMADVDLVEINEAFAAQSLACMRELSLDADRVNVNGGAIALGHPLGMSGARLVGTLVHELKRREGRRGIATMCVGVGQGVAVALERA